MTSSAATASPNSCPTAVTTGACTGTMTMTGSAAAASPHVCLTTTTGVCTGTMTMTSSAAAASPNVRPAAVTTGAVSYTHVTLPTTCSV
eukprot:7341560-Prorocentrum_lima.AAC.1